ncbi:MAG: hypothetical protein AB8G23_20440 [Myxococcota bacterium]
MLPRILSGLVGLFFFAQAANFLLSPEAGAAALGMPLLDGIARSTQVGDISGVFLTIALLCGLGIARQSPHGPRAAGILLATIAVSRILAWLVSGAAFAAVPIGVEFVTAGLLFFAAARFEAGSNAPD